MHKHMWVMWRKNTDRERIGKHTSTTWRSKFPTEEATSRKLQYFKQFSQTMIKEKKLSGVGKCSHINNNNNEETILGKTLLK